MNERLQELLKRAEERYPKHLAVAVPEVALREDALGLFAELIVSKCSSMLRETAKILQETGSEDEAYILRAHANGLETYFGVKK
jgi:hypothetical protein